MHHGLARTHPTGPLSKKYGCVIKPWRRSAFSQAKSNGGEQRLLKSFEEADPG